MTTERAPYADVLPPPGWEPKSDFFKWVMAKAKNAREHPRVAFQCPHCGLPITMTVMSSDPPPQ